MKKHYTGSMKQFNETLVKMLVVSGQIKRSVEVAEKCNISPKRYEQLVKSINSK